MTPRALFMAALAATAVAPQTTPLLALAAVTRGAPDRPAVAATEADGQTFREIRAAEVAGDLAALDGIEKSRPGARAATRLALAREAIRLRAQARTQREAMEAEREIERLRGALIAKIAADAPRAARELSLESAEDLLLRELTLGSRDALVAVGLPSEAELREIDAVRAAADARLASEPVADAYAAGAAIATDAAVFRAHALRGLARAVEADVARLGPDPAAAARIGEEARRLLERASLCELPVPKALGDILALARGRLERDAATRERLLTRAADSADAVTSFVARVTRWRDAGMRGAFPAVAAETAGGDALARMACVAEIRARGAAVGGGASSDAGAIAAPIERLLARTDGPQRVRATLEWLSERLPAELRARAARDDAPPALFAAAAIARDGGGTIEAAPAAAARAARDGVVGPAIALRVAERLAANGDAERAARTILDAVRDFDGLANAREALEIALDILRARSDAKALDGALELALSRFGNDPMATAWRLERVDLALYGPAEMRDLSRAAALLAAIPTRGVGEIDRGAIDLRRIELEVERALASPARDRSDRAGTRADAQAATRARLVELGKEAMQLDVDVLAGAGTESAPRHQQTLPARAAAVRAAIARAGGDAAMACMLAERACGDPRADAATATRAAQTWVEGALATGEPVHLPTSVRGCAARSAGPRAWIAEPLARLVDETEAAIAAGRPPKTQPGAIEALATMLSVGRDTPAAASLRVFALGRLAALDRAEAARLARESLESDPDDRLARWVLAEALRAGSGDDARLEAFALYRALSPIGAGERDRFWWRAQLAQLEMLAETPGRAAETDIVARVNRLSALDPALGGAELARRFEAVRKRALAGGDGAGGRAGPPARDPQRKD